MLALVLLLPCASARTAGADGHRLCDGAATVEDLIACVEQHSPGRYSEGYVAPSAIERMAWTYAVDLALRGACRSTYLPWAISRFYELRALTDAQTRRDYCVLIEVGDGDGDGVVDRGWGTFVVDRAARRRLDIQIPHPIFDSDTNAQGALVFKWSSGHSLYVAGAHRKASTEPSQCQSSYERSDPAHNAESPMQAATEALVTYYASAAIADYAVLQFHGMADSSCGCDVYLTHGRNIAPSRQRPVALSDRIVALRTALHRHNASWSVGLPGQAQDSPAHCACNLNGTTNTQGRLLNGVGAGAVCTAPAGGHDGHFVHIEQRRHARDASRWIAAIADTWDAETVRETWP